MVSSIAQDLQEVLESEAASELSDLWQEWLTNMHERLVQLDNNITPIAPSKRRRSESIDSTLPSGNEEPIVWVLTYEEGVQSHDAKSSCACAFGTRGQALENSARLMSQNCSWTGDWRQSADFEEHEDNRDHMGEHGRVIYLKAGDGKFSQVCLHKIAFNRDIDIAGLDVDSMHVDAASAQGNCDQGHVDVQQEPVLGEDRWGQGSTCEARDIELSAFQEQAEVLNSRAQEGDGLGLNEGCETPKLVDGEFSCLELGTESCQSILNADGISPCEVGEVSSLQDLAQPEQARVNHFDKEIQEEVEEEGVLGSSQPGEHRAEDEQSLPRNS